MRRAFAVFDIRVVEELCGDVLSFSIIEEDNESELLLDFLVLLKEQKQKDASKLMEEISCLEADIKETERSQTNEPLVLSCLPRESPNARGNRLLHQEHSSLDVQPTTSSASDTGLTLMRNISQLESAYFSVRSSRQLTDNDVMTRDDNELLETRENWYQSQKDIEKHRSRDCLGVFFNGLCKFAHYKKFEVQGILRNGDFSNSANVICSLSFDRDEDYFAAAGLWDAGTSQGFSQYIEHNKRAWSVDFSRVDPTKLASGSDDCSVKLWSINEKNSLCTIRNIANVCCVQFSSNSTHLLGFGSADYKTYCYDLRNVLIPWCTLAGHEKAVSYLKFMDSETLVSASTDNTLKLWDLSKTSSSGLSTNACVLTLRGHANEKVGCSMLGAG
ncbi:unnamed protein product [Ilex paraguariensis]|uniref:Uncharacterized protein n=1 Tax=Ilex paraguariensis TaxID=185542 RepID=A0ABC8T7J4_9AQUA